MSDPYRADTTVSPDLLAEFNAGTEKARKAYADKPNACTREIWKAGSK